MKKHVCTLLQIIVFFIREIGQKGPKSDNSQLDQGAILGQINFDNVYFDTTFFTKLK
jgi:hypothetical protein